MTDKNKRVLKSSNIDVDGNVREGASIPTTSEPWTALPVDWDGKTRGKCLLLGDAIQSINFQARLAPYQPEEASLADKDAKRRNE